MDKFLIISNEENELIITVDGFGDAILKVDNGTLTVSANGVKLELTSQHEYQAQTLEEKYFNALQAKVNELDPSVTITSEFSDQAFEDGVTITKAVEQWFEPGEFSLESLKGLKGDVNKLFGNFPFHLLERPFIKLSGLQYNAFENQDTQFFLTNGGKVVTYGWSDGCGVLMPFNDEAASYVKEAQVPE